MLLNIEVSPRKLDKTRFLRFYPASLNSSCRLEACFIVDVFDLDNPFPVVWFCYDTGTPNHRIQSTATLFSELWKVQIYFHTSLYPDIGLALSD